MTRDDRFAVVSALLDREAVDPDMLRVALEEPKARAELVDFVRLRERLAHELTDPEPVAARTAGSRARLWVARAAMLLLPLLSGLAAGAWWAERRELRPPEPDRVIRFVRGVDWK